MTAPGVGIGAGIGTLIEPGGGTIVGGILGGLVATGLGIAGGKAIADHMSNANTQAQQKLNTQAQNKACATCKTNPCGALAQGVPGSKYRGGADGAMTKPTGDKLDSHHTPAAAASPLPREMGPAIQMDPSDHWRTASNGRVPGSGIYIADQRTLINGGNFMGAMAMDVADIHAKFGTKYDDALAQMSLYADCLKQNNIVR